MARPSRITLHTSAGQARGRTPDEVAAFRTWVLRGTSDTSQAARFPTVDFARTSRLLDDFPEVAKTVVLEQRWVRARTAPKLSPELRRLAAEAPWPLVDENPSGFTWKVGEFGDPDAHVVRVYRDGGDWYASVDGRKIPPPVADKRKRTEKGAQHEESVRTDPIDALKLALKVMTRLLEKPVAPVEPKTPAILPPAPDPKLHARIHERTPSEWELETVSPELGLVVWKHDDDRVALRNLPIPAEPARAARAAVPARPTSPGKPAQAAKPAREARPAKPERSSWRLETPTGPKHERWDTFDEALDQAIQFIMDYRAPVRQVHSMFDGPEWAVSVIAQVVVLETKIAGYLASLGFDGYQLQSPKMEGKRLSVTWVSPRAQLSVTVESTTPPQLVLRRAFQGPSAKVGSLGQKIDSADDITQETLFPEEWLMDRVLPQVRMPDERLPATSASAAERFATLARKARASEEHLDDDRRTFVPDEDRRTLPPDSFGTGVDEDDVVEKIIVAVLQSFATQAHEAFCAPDGVDRVLSLLCSDMGREAITAVVFGPAYPFVRWMGPEGPRRAIDAAQARLCSPAGRQIIQRTLADIACSPAGKKQVGSAISAAAERAGAAAAERTGAA